MREVTRKEAAKGVVASLKVGGSAGKATAAADTIASNWAGEKESTRVDSREVLEAQQQQQQRDQQLYADRILEVWEEEETQLR